MGFEKKVLAITEPLLKEGETAHFFCGTLFIECDETTSRKVFSELFMKVSPKILINRMGCEFAIDFA